LHPVLLEIGWFRLHSYGVLLALGTLAAIWKASRAAPGRGIPESAMVDAGLLALLTGLAGARLTYVLLNRDVFAGDPLSAFAIWDGGLTFFGGLAAGAVSVAVWAVRRGFRLADVADVCAPSLALGYSIARVGCFLNGCCYGCETRVPWAVRFHADGGDALTPPSHPVQLYSTALSFLIFLLLVRLERRGPRPGALFGSWLVLSSLERFFLEFLRRGATAQELAGGLTQGQAASLVLLLAGALLIARAPGRPGRA